MTSKQLGNFGERITECYLKNKGYQILDKNYSNKFVSGPQRGEIDIIAQKSDTISFIEVKTLTQNGQSPNQRDPAALISPEEKVDFQKQRKLVKTAESWLTKNKISLNTKWQIDVMSIKVDLNSKKAKIRHFKNAVF